MSLLLQAKTEKMGEFFLIFVFGGGGGLSFLFVSSTYVAGSRSKARLGKANARRERVGLPSRVRLAFGKICAYS